MEGACLRCGAHLAPAFKFCPACGVTVPHEHAVPEHDKAPVNAAFGGLILGAVVMPILLIVGSMLCLTGLGAFLGVPMIICGVLAPLAGPMIGLGSIKGECPWCGAAVNTINSRQSFDCEACKKPIAVRDHKFVTAG